MPENFAKLAQANNVVDLAFLQKRWGKYKKVGSPHEDLVWWRLSSVLDSFCNILVDPGGVSV